MTETFGNRLAPAACFVVDYRHLLADYATSMAEIATLRESDASLALVGEAPAFRAALAQVSQLAALDRPVLVVGERGTGKELVAARLTYLSPRWDKPFIKLNCATLAETLLDSELFGHEAGAFTGATRRRLSRFELADAGTLFLDEIATASLAVQEKILRVIEYGSFERVGGNEVHHVDVRVIAATNVDLPQEAEAGRFRHDLLDRLAFDVVTIPPLRERIEDIPLLAQHFGRAMAHELGRSGFPGFGTAALAALQTYRWPGNVRELKNVVERSLYRWPQPEEPVADVVFDAFASPHRPATLATAATAPPSAPPVGRDFHQQIEALERQLVGEALATQHFHQRRTAEALGLTYHQLRHYLRKHRLGARH
jgi:psp operon transcriptional activator